jgi:hypothetical protein
VDGETDANAGANATTTTTTKAATKKNTGVLHFVQDDDITEERRKIEVDAVTYVYSWPRFSFV